MVLSLFIHQSYFLTLSYFYKEFIIVNKIYSFLLEKYFINMKVISTHSHHESVGCYVLQKL